MKRKTKLISSIFSLALAFAFMSFGVYAAAKTATISGSLSFTGTAHSTSIAVSSIAAKDTAVKTSDNFGSATTKTVSETDGQTWSINFDFNDTNLYAGIKVVLTAAHVSGVTISYNIPTASNFTIDTYKNTTKITSATNFDLANSASETFYYLFELKNPKTIANFTTASAYTITFNIDRKAVA